MALYSSHIIIGAPVDRSRYLVQHPRPCFAHRPDSSSVFTQGLGPTQYNRSINIRLIYDCMIPFYITRYDISCEYTESIMQYTSNQHKSIQDFTYIHTKGPSASYLALLAISDIPHRVRWDFALSPVYFTESYYDKHTNTTEICPDYYIYLLERSICLMFSIMINIRQVSRCVIHIYKLNSIQLCTIFHPNIACTSALIKRPLTSVPQRDALARWQYQRLPRIMHASS